MSIKSIKIKNLLSFDELYIKDFQDINCIVGKNNAGKSNLLKLIRFFYNKLDGKRELPPTLNSKYSSFGTIEITFDTTRIKSIVTSQTNKEKSKYFKHIYNTLFKDKEKNNIFEEFIEQNQQESFYTLILQINYDDSTKWLNTNQDILKVINYLYPFFAIEARHLDLYDWDKLWQIVSRLKSFDVNTIEQDVIVNFFNNQISIESNNYKDYVEKIEKITKTDKYSYREKVLNFVKAGLKGQTFLINEQSLEIQSDGTNAHKFIEIALELLITLSRREYISPTIYIDEPELGLHPKRNEELIYKLYDVYQSFKKTKEKQEKGKQKTPYPKIIFATHSPNIVKEVIKLFDENQQILHFSKKSNEPTKAQKMNSTYQDKRFLNIFSDNEARLFFSNFILFVEGETELEIFSNKKLLDKFPKLKQIDVYKSSSNVLGSYINPSYSNTSIPYLFLFDADKIYSFKRDNTNQKSRRLKLENKNSNLYILPDGKRDNEIKFQKIIDKYSKGFIGKRSSQQRYKDKLKTLKSIQDIKNKNFTFNKASFTINETDEFKKTIKILQEYLIDYKVKFLHTTIEEILISNFSKDLFFSWLETNYNININKCIYKTKISETYRYIYKKRVGLGYLIINKHQVPMKLLSKQKRIYITPDILIEYLRLLFDGKMELLISYKNILDKNNKNFQSKRILNLLEEKLTKQSKTSGWTTNFLNFAIDEIEKSRGNNSFRKEFKLYFEELYDIINSIENKL